MLRFRKIPDFLKKRSPLDLFLIKGAGLVVLYYLLRVVIKFVPSFSPVFVFCRESFKTILVYGSNIVVSILGYNTEVRENILLIVGSPGVKVINACIGWSVMALFVGFVAIYPGKKKSRYWFIPLGLVIIIAVNILRIAAMTIIVFKRVEILDFYHQYIFNVVLLLVVFSQWFWWVSMSKKVALKL